MDTNNRASFGSRLGFILVTAGCAVGLGNVWRFPFITGQSGGAIFVIFYLLFLVILGVPILTVELSIGRASRNSAAKAFGILAPKHKSWKVLSYLCMTGLYLLMSYYCVVTGWLMFYGGRIIQGDILGQSTDHINSYFGKLLTNPIDQIFCSIAVLFIVCLICYRGVKEGVEKFIKPTMIGMLIIMLVLAGYAMSLDKASNGIEFFLKPNVDKAHEVGWMTVISNAMTQVFFTLSAGIGSILIFGSYITKSHSLVKEAVIITSIDTVVAFLAGLIIFPACFNYDVNVNAGPGLIFNTMPLVFNQMPGGTIIGCFFFIFLFIAALTTVIAVVEAIIAGCMELFGWTRHFSSIINFIVIVLLSVPVVLGYNVLSDVHPLGGESTILDFLDFLVSNNLLPIGALLMIIFCVYKFGWGWKNYISEVNTGHGLKFPDGQIAHNYYQIILPIMIIIILAVGYYGIFS